MGIKEMVNVQVDHCRQAYGVSVTLSCPASPDKDCKLVYSGDTRPCDAVSQLLFCSSLSLLTVSLLGGLVPYVGPAADWQACAALFFRFAHAIRHVIFNRATCQLLAA